MLPKIKMSFKMVNKAQKKFAPFGSSVNRFGKITGHPGLDPSGLHAVRPDGCDPCLYHPKPIEKICELTRTKDTTKCPWRYKKELEEWAQNLGYRNQRVLDYRSWHRSLLGPAWHSVSEPPPHEPACKNVGFGRTPRTKPIKFSTPGPGTYCAQPSGPRTQSGPHSIRPTFEREEPCRFKDSGRVWSLAPNRYHIVDKKSIEQKSKIIISKRGPYDLLTGKRDGSTIKNHFSNSGKCTAATWPIDLKTTLDKYEKSHFGTMNKTSRNKPYRGRNALVDLSMCVRSPEEPGPAHLNIDKPKVFTHYRHGFNSSYDKPPGYQRAVVWPAVGRYSWAAPARVPGHGHRHVFRSVAQRTIGAVLPQPMNSF